MGSWAKSKKANDFSEKFWENEGIISSKNVTKDISWYKIGLKYCSKPSKKFLWKEITF